MPTPLANVMIKTNSFGSTIPRKNVTPAELMFLIADNRDQCQGNPVVEFDLIKDNAEEVPIEKLGEDISRLEAVIVEQEEKTDISEEVRDKRIERIRAQLDVKRDKLMRLHRIVKLRDLSPIDERNRLESHYGTLRIRKFYPGQFPSMPQTFDEAKKAGMQASTKSACLLGNEMAS